MKKSIIAGLALTLTLSLTSAVMAESDADEINNKLSECVFQDSALAGTHIDFTTTDLDGNQVNSADLFSNAEITMVNIWRTTCGFCVDEFPRMNEIANDISGKDFQIVTYCADANNDEKLETARGLVGGYDGMVHLAADSSVDDALLFEATPTNYFVNREGYLVSPGLEGALVNYYEQLFDYYQTNSIELAKNGAFENQDEEESEASEDAEASEENDASEETETAEDNYLEPAPGTEVAQPGDVFTEDDGSLVVYGEDGELHPLDEDTEASENTEENTDEADETTEAADAETNEQYPQPDFISELEADNGIYEDSPAVGTHVEFTTKGLNGAELDSDRLFSNAEITMVNIWRTGCDHCVAEFPQMEEIAEEYADKDCQIVTYCADAIDEESCARAEELLGNCEYLGRLANDMSFCESLPFEGTPTTYFVNREGNIVSPGFQGVMLDYYGRLFDFYLEHSTAAE